MNSIAEVKTKTQLQSEIDLEMAKVDHLNKIMDIIFGISKEAKPTVYKDGPNLFYTYEGLVKSSVRTALCVDCPKADECVTLSDEDECEEFHQAVEKAFEEGER
jgi:hypothetical protein